MSCNNPLIPIYLHFNNDKKLFSDDDFKSHQKYYRLKSNDNPIIPPQGKINALSGNWSFLIEKKDIVTTHENPELNEYEFAFIREIKAFRLTRINSDKSDEYFGKHILSCYLKHSPETCNYSHCEIFIKHQIFQSNDSVFEETYSSKSWDKKKALLRRRKGDFYLKLKRDYRVEMIKLISRPSLKNNLFFNVLFNIFRV